MLVASLLGSAHCAGMCGGFVCFYSGGTGATRATLRAHAPYNGGRLVVLPARSARSPARSAPA